MYHKEIVLSPYTKGGYLYFNDKDHPLAPYGDARVLLHRHVASIKLGRWLTPEEHVHHIDENILNNDPSNLEILSNIEHILLHNPPIQPRDCIYCFTTFTPECSRITHCSVKCAQSSAIKNKELTKETLDELIPNTSWTDLGKMFGYSDSGIKKRAKALGCDITKAKYLKPRSRK